MNNMSQIHQRVQNITYIDLVGSGVSQFLKGQLTINSDLVDDKVAKLAAFCNHKGRVISLFHILRIENGFRLIMPDSIVEGCLKQVKKYSVFFDLKIITDKNQFISARIDNEKCSEQEITIEFTDLRVLFASSTKLTNTNNISDDDFWFWQMAKRSIPWLTLETIEHFLPHSLNLPKLGAVDFTKGCFTGQEVIARMQYKGKLKQHLKRLESCKITNKAIRGMLSQDNKKVGEIVCSANHPTDGCIVLAVIKDSADKDKKFQLKLENASILELKLNN